MLHEPINIFMPLLPAITVGTSPTTGCLFSPEDILGACLAVLYHYALNHVLMRDRCPTFNATGRNHIVPDPFSVSTLDGRSTNTYASATAINHLIDFKGPADHGSRSTTLRRIGNDLGRPRRDLKQVTVSDRCTPSGPQPLLAFDRPYPTTPGATESNALQLLPYSRENSLLTLLPGLPPQTCRRRL